MSSATEKKDIRDLTEKQLFQYLKDSGQPTFRAGQIYQWLWQKGVSSFDEMSNLPKLFRESLNNDFELNKMTIDTAQNSTDGTIKYRFRLHDGHLIEGVLIPSGDRMTACISSQVGCSLSCKFCATGFLKRERNLSAAEIFDQVIKINEESEKHYAKPLTNIVFMGMGEPLLNYKNVLQGIEYLNADNGRNISAKRITVSTAGIAKMIRKLANDDVAFNLALSLHAANDKKRSEIMPINDQNSLESLMESLEYFHSATHNRITYEYIVFDGFNDSLQDAAELADLCGRFPVRINIIEYNPISEASFQNAKEDRVLAFKNYLEKKKVTVTLRRSRGKDIDAACGQLANK